MQVTGAVGDVRPFLARAWVFVAPLRIAQGVQNKVLEAMASNLPVVCSERVLAGLADGGFRSGRDLLAADDDEGMERCRRDLLDDAARARDAWPSAARQRLLATYRWAPNLEPLRGSDRWRPPAAGHARRLPARRPSAAGGRGGGARRA